MLMYMITDRARQIEVARKVRRRTLKRATLAISISLTITIAAFWITATQDVANLKLMLVVPSKTEYRRLSQARNFSNSASSFQSHAETQQNTPPLSREPTQHYQSEQPRDFIPPIKGSDNYFLKAWEGDFDMTSAQLPPLRIVQQYIREHSQFALKLEWQTCQDSLPDTTISKNLTAEELFAAMRKTKGCEHFSSRKFVVAFYSCPAEAGNRLHRFMNAMIQGIRSNRTMLWRYLDYDGCVDDPNSDLVVPRSDEVRRECKAERESFLGCDEVLQRAAWIPGWNEWNAVLNFKIPPSLAHLTHGSISTFQPLSNVPLVIRIGHMVKPDRGFLTQDDPKDDPLAQQKKKRAHELMGVPSLYFLYGMLFESLFTMQPHLLPDSSLLPEQPKTTNSIFLHSRHPYPTDKGNYTYPEELCLKYLVENTTKPCHVFIMSDRNYTVEYHQRFAKRTYNCSASVANHDTNEDMHLAKLRWEHGPFSGIGYFQDLALARNARYGAIAFHRNVRGDGTIRTSSSLIRSQVEFRRVLEMTSKEYRTYSQDDFAMCTNPWREDGIVQTKRARTL